MRIADYLAARIVQSVLGPISLIYGNHISEVARRLGRFSNGRTSKRMAMFCQEFLRTYKNCDYDCRSNGEQWLVTRLSAFRPAVVFDVGANVGNWLTLAQATFPGAQFHAFEIVPTTFAALAERMAGNAGVALNNFGLSNCSESIRMHVFDISTELSSHVAFPHGSHHEIVCPVRRGDQYMRDKGIERIDLLKIDVEGAEHLVLEGFGAALATQIDVIQFEYGRVNIMTHFLLRDFYELLEASGYLVGKLFPNYVDFRNYELYDEDFLGPNYIAVRKVKSRIIDALRKS
jgi:FkbM family methyltransferase